LFVDILQRINPHFYFHWFSDMFHFKSGLKRFVKIIFILTLLLLPSWSVNKPRFKVIAFFTAKNDKAHISFVYEANRWFSEEASKYNFIYDSTADWNNLNHDFLRNYQVVIFLDTRPETTDQRSAFREYMEKGGAWMGFHFAAFSLNNSAIPQNWDWYHNTFLGSGEYKGNTWRPTSAVLRIEDINHPVTRGLPETYIASPNEWYSWKNDLRNNPDIRILLSIDSTSFPLGTGPKQNEIWHKGFYPVAWTNTKFRMLYFNMGHNDIDYENKTNRELSFTFTSDTGNKVVLKSLFWLVGLKFPEQ
jgi:uncharacterized protein